MLARTVLLALPAPLGLQLARRCHSALPPSCSSRTPPRLEPTASSGTEQSAGQGPNESAVMSVSHAWVVLSLAGALGSASEKRCTQPAESPAVGQQQNP